MKSATSLSKFFFILTSFVLAIPSLSHATQSKPVVVDPAVLQKVEAGGKIPVIIRLKVNTQPAGLLSLTAEKNQKDNIQFTRQALLSRLSKHDPKNLKKFQHVPFTAMELDAAGVSAAMSDPDVEGIYEDKLNQTSLFDSTLLTGSTTSNNAGADGSGQVVAILDTGVDSSHPFLANKVVHEACFSKTLTSSTSACPNGSNSQIGVGAAAPCSTSGCNHGTHVAGISAGKGIGFSGIAPEANVMAVQVFSEFDANYCGGSPCVLAYTSDIISGLEHVYSQRNNFNIASVNMSLGGGSYSTACDDSPMKAAVDLLLSVNIATVIASGNDGYTNSMSSPACISTAISVGATSKTDTVASYSNSVSFLDILAPGSSIQSSVPGTGYAYMSGTSMATPHVSGTFAALRSKYPNASVETLLNTLKTTGTDILDTRNSITKPRIQLDAAFTALKPQNGHHDFDFDGDGKADIFWRNAASGKNHLFIMDGINITDSNVVPQISDINWKLAEAGDIDGDGNADLVWRHAVTGLIWIHLMNGSTIVTSSALTKVSDLNWKIVGMGDLDGNGTKDIILRHQISGKNWVYLLDGINITSSVAINTISDAQWKFDAIADLNGDGKDDILLRNHTTGMNWVYLMNGATISVSSFLHTISDTNWEIAGANDLDGDGKADVLWRNAVTGLNWIHLMDGINVTTSSALDLIPDNNWKVGQLSDFDGDGNADILWRNSATGLNWEYLMNGINLIQSSAVTIVDTDWKIRGK